MINSKMFPFSFFLSSKKVVSDMEAATIKYGGSTHNLTTGEMWSNVDGNEYISIKEDNTVTVFIPDTINTNEKANDELVKNVITYVSEKIRQKYHISPLAEKAIGTWYSEELEKIVTDNITLVTIKLQKLEAKDIWFAIGLAKYVKKIMKQEGVSVAINDSLAII